jgi:uncharacterized protein (TIGR02145 family)
MKYLSFLFLSSIMINFCKAQNVGIGTNTPSPAAMLDVQSTSKGMLIPRMTTTQRDAMLSPTIGLQIFNLTDSTINVFNGLSWIKQNAIDSTKWSISGNANTNPLNNFIGTTDANDFVLRTNGLEGLRLKSLSPVTSTQVNPFDVLVLTNPGTSNNKWPLSASFRLGSYQSSIDAHTQLDIALGDNATPIPDTRVMSLYGNGDVNIAGVGSFGQYLKIGTDVAEGYFQNAVDGAYRALNLNNTTQGYWFQNYNGVNTTMYVGLAGAYAGKVGINILTPENQLSVNGNADFSGNVGVGTTSPGAKLEVAGGLKISDSINIGGQVRIMSGTPGAGKVLTSNATGVASWTTPSTPTIPDALPTIQIGTQKWMSKNLDVAFYRNGDPIPQVTDPTTWAGLTTGAWCYYNNDPIQGNKYGKLYNWYAVNDPRGLAPQGWHLPSDAEWTTLGNTLGGELVAGGKMKEPGTFNWTAPNTGADNSSGFAGLPGGFRNSSGTFFNVGNYGYWWSSTEPNTAFAWYRYLYYGFGFIGRDDYGKQNGFSVRCLRD